MNLIQRKRLNTTTPFFLTYTTFIYKVHALKRYIFIHVLHIY